MDFILRCNSLRCRNLLNDKAIVTTCSHIFCTSCADSLGFSAPNVGGRVCPACQTRLDSPDDAALTQLNPAEDYKTSVLSGLSPQIIMDCASRSLAFYTYQVTQEIFYQEYLAKGIAEKLETANSNLDCVMQEANNEIGSLRNKLDGEVHDATIHVRTANLFKAMKESHTLLQQRSNDLAEAIRAKDKAYQKTRHMYQNLKAQVMASQVATAASNSADIMCNATTQVPKKTYGSVEVDGADQMQLSSYTKLGPRSLHNRQRSGNSRFSGKAAGTSQKGNVWSNAIAGQANHPLESQANQVQPQYRTRLPVPVPQDRLMQVDQSVTRAANNSHYNSTTRQSLIGRGGTVYGSSLNSKNGGSSQYMGRVQNAHRSPIY